VKLPLLEGAPLQLAGDDVLVWFAEPEQITDPALAQRYFDLLDDGERAQHARFHFQRDRDLYLVAHALLRTTLSRLCAVDPRDWRFRTEEHGKPELAGPVCDLRFNLSHTRGLVMLGVTRALDLGVDVERIDPTRSSDEIAERFFAPKEAAAVRGAPALRFFEYWTLKEAYLKACGVGLGLPLECFGFELAPPAPRISFEPPIVDDPACWQFVQLFPAEGHVAAVAVRRGAQMPDVAIRAYRSVPGIDEEPLAI
jgi:4'-phosphopantetheinyl transferase